MMNQNMTDREYIDDVLLTSKTASELYHFATQESSTEDVHCNFKNILNESLDMQHEIFCVMEQKGWYAPAQAQKQQIDQVKQKFQN